MSCIKRAICAPVLGVLLLAGVASAGTIYLTDGDSSVMHRVDLTAGTYLGSTTTFNLAYPIAVVDTVRLGHRDNEAGQEYNLDGTLTGVTWPGGDLISQLLDGTTDAANYNYAVGCCGSDAVYRFDRFWGNAELLFTLPNGGSGITYDPVNGTIWVTLFDGTLREYSLTGTELNSFNTGLYMVALSYDAGSNSFWTFDQSQTFSNLDRNGSILGSVVIDGFPSNNLYGGEMVMSDVGQIPEPGTVALVGIGVLAIFGYRRRRRNQSKPS